MTDSTTPTPFLGEMSLNRCHLFQNVAESVVQTVFAAGFRFTYEAEMPIVTAQGEGETFFLILKGMVKVVIAPGKSLQANVTVLQPGDFFGELALLDILSVRTANVIALTEVEVLALQK